MNVPLSHFNAIRSAEISRVLSEYGPIFKDKDVLEIGSGTGIQLRAISKVANSAVGLELSGGAYIRDTSLNVAEYDGMHIPFPASSFDAVFSSNVMEHIREQLQIDKEIRRVLRPGGKVIHVMPTRVWRVLTSLLHYPLLIARVLPRRARSISQPQVMRTHRQSISTVERIKNTLIPAKHGELGNWLAEYRYFGVSQWQKHFARMGWTVEAAEPIGLIYSGNCLLAERLSIPSRITLSRVFGSSAAIFVLS
jgi:SAM-dependent methyltransferase